MTHTPGVSGEAGSGAPSRPAGAESASGESSGGRVQALIDRWHEMLADGEITPEELAQFVAELRAAWNDPEARAELEAAGITPGVMDRLEAGVDNPEDFDIEAWETTFDALALIAGDGEFGLTSPARGALIELNLRLSALTLDNSRRETESLTEAEGVIKDAEARARESGGEVSFTDEEIEILRDSGLAPEDVENEQVKAILAGEPGAEDATLSADELDAVGDDVKTKRDAAATATDEWALEVTRLQQERQEWYAMKSTLSASRHDVMMSAAESLRGAGG